LGQLLVGCRRGRLQRAGAVDRTVECLEHGAGRDTGRGVRDLRRELSGDTVADLLRYPHGPSVGGGANSAAALVSGLCPSNRRRPCGDSPRWLVTSRVSTPRTTWWRSAPTWSRGRCWLPTVVGSSRCR